MSETTEAIATATHTVRSPGGQQDPATAAHRGRKARGVIRESSPGFFSPKSELGRSDTAFNNAGVMLLGPVEDASTSLALPFSRPLDIILIVVAVAVAVAQSRREETPPLPHPQPLGGDA
jgi:hypothetical protein